MTAKTLKIGTRKSKLALWQAHFVQQKLQDAGINSELVLQETKGDKILNVSISKIGSKGVFTEELEHALSKGDIDIAVHSAKDMPAQLPEEFELIAFTKRETPTDCIVAEQKINLSHNELTFGTSSTRRIALLKHYYPHIRTVDMRGNLQTRIKKMKDGACDALLLAYAGVHRMKYHELIQYQLPLTEFVPAVGQGSIAIEASFKMPTDTKNQIREAVNHEITEKIITAERSFLAAMQGGCSIPIFALGSFSDNKINLNGGIISLDGSELIQQTSYNETSTQAGFELAKMVINKGGDRILKEIKKQQNEFN